MKNKISIGNLFLSTSLCLLVLGLCFGILASLNYLIPNSNFLGIGFSALRPLHVSSVIFWIILGATGCVYSGLTHYAKTDLSNTFSTIQFGFWILAILGIYYSYFTKNFGGREYWEFNPKWALPIALAWILFIFNFMKVVAKIKKWPVYIWMWFTGILFFLFTFTENYLWLFPFFREHFITDMTIQWKVNGSLVGSWNQLIYGTAFFLMDKIENKQEVGRNKLAFAMYFLGLFNLMFNWGHHIYTLPTEPYIRYIGYIVSMTEWIFFIRIFYTWKQSVNSIRKNYHYFPYRFLMAADIWVFINLGQAILMSIPALNIYTHGTHITVAHAMGTTIGINSMILLAACFEFLDINIVRGNLKYHFLRISFWLTQFSLFTFWISLNLAGIRKSQWQMSTHQSSYSLMMESLKPYFTAFIIAGTGLMIALSVIALILLLSSRKKGVIPA